MFQPTIRILTSLLFVLNCGIVIGQTKADEQYALGQNIADTNFKAAIPVFYEALEGFENQNELRKQISTIDNIGACLAQIGEVDSARAMYTRAINLAHEGTDSEFLLETYYNYIVNCSRVSLVNIYSVITLSPY